MFNTSSNVKVVKGQHRWDNGVNLIKTGVGILRLWKSGECGGGSECEIAELTHIPVGFEFTEEFLINFGKIFVLSNGSPFTGTYDTDDVRIPAPIVDTFTNKIVGYSWQYWPSTN